jgi:hypothetical protein
MFSEKTKIFVLLGGCVQYDNATYGIVITLLPIINKRQAALWPALANCQVGRYVPLAASIIYRIWELSPSPRGEGR